MGLFIDINILTFTYAPSSTYTYTTQFTRCVYNEFFFLTQVIFVNCSIPS